MSTASIPSPARRVPVWLKLVFTAFVAVLVPVYWRDYGPTNFLYFCDVALLMTLAAMWLENALLASAALVGIFLPQMLWVVDFLVQASGNELTGLTGYMFDPRRDLFLRGLSFFHFWLPFLLLYLAWRLGYDRRALPVWTVIAWGLMFVCYFLMPPPPASPETPNLPVNINYVYGLSDEPQTWMPANVYFALLLVVLPVGLFLPSHLLFCWLFRRPEEVNGVGNESGPARGPGREESRPVSAG